MADLSQGILPAILSFVDSRKREISLRAKGAIEDPEMATKQLLGNIAETLQKGATGSISDFVGTFGGPGIILSKGRLDNLISRYGVAHDDRTKAALTQITPNQFLELTTAKPPRGNPGAQTTADGAFTRKAIMDSADNFDAKRFAEENQYPFLDITDGFVGGHEGRHRMAALIKAGKGDVPVPVVVNNGYTKDLDTIRNMLSREQGIQGQFADVQVKGLPPAIPLHWSLEEELLKLVDDSMLTGIGK